MSPFALPLSPCQPAGGEGWGEGVDIELQIL